jgi:hypothetical protein
MAMGRSASDAALVRTAHVGCRDVFAACSLSITGRCSSRFACGQKGGPEAVTRLPNTAVAFMVETLGRADERGEV